MTIKSKFRLAVTAALCALTLAPAAAQRSTKAKAKADRHATKGKQAPKGTEQEPSPLFEQMLSATADVTVIDSTAAATANITSSIPLNKACGTIMPLSKFKGAKPLHYTAAAGDTLYAYVNDFGNKAYMAAPDGKGSTMIYTTDLIAGQWSQPQPIFNFGGGYKDFNYPFMMPDGMTLYFAARGEHSLGGYDVFVTRLDTESMDFYKPENIGLPYNSTDDDIYYITSEIDSLGWMVTNRRMDAGKWTILTFSADGERENLPDDMDEEKLLGRAKIERISDTWTDKKKADMAKARLAHMRKSAILKSGSKATFSFHINDNTVYTDSSQFKSATNREQFAKLLKIKQQSETDEEELQLMRQAYHSATAKEKAKLAPVIQKKEQVCERTDAIIKDMEKAIRNAENTTIRR